MSASTLEDAYRDRRVLLTGASGFKGSWLALVLTMLGAKVRGISLPPRSDRDHFVMTGLGDLIDHRVQDIRDADGLRSAVREWEPSVVFHLGAQALVKVSYEEPRQTFEVNVGGSVNLLDAVHRSPSVEALVYITSDKCYRNKEWVWGYRENDELGGDDPYSASKAAAELAFTAYQRSIFSARPGLGAATARAGNVIGGGDWSPYRIVPDVIRSLLAGATITLRSPEATRPWQHVLDPVFGYLQLGERLLSDPRSYAGSWNFGPDGRTVRTVAELAQSAVKVWGSGSVVTEPPNGGVHEAGLLQLNCEKAHQQLGWSARIDFERAVEQTVSWYRQVFVDGKAARGVSEGQILQFMGALA